MGRLAPFPFKNNIIISNIQSQLKKHNNYVKM
nr:MAG TPA: hypothetical protein [Bacteriophage sp.]